MRKFNIAIVPAVVGLFVAGCADPADSVHKSAATEAAQVSQNEAAAGNDYVVRPESSSIGFIGSKVTGSHDGGFKNFSGTIKVADGKIVGAPEIKIDLNSIWSDNDRLTGHLKSADFFDVEKFPTATFTVTKVEPSGDQHNVTGNLDLHGVTKSISFPAKVEITDAAVKVTADFAINRKDFGINYPGKQDDLIRDDVVLKLAINAAPVESQNQIAN